MTEPTPPSRWSALRKRMSEALGRGRSRVNPLVVASVVLGLVLIVVLVVWVNALTLPVHRDGRPTASVEPLPAPTTASATPTPSDTATPSATPTQAGPTPSAGPTMSSSGKFDTAGVTVAAASSSGTLRKYSVRVETSTKLDADKVGRQIAGVLNDPRSWVGSGNVRFALVADPAKADLTITLAAPGTAKKLCTPEPSTCLDSGDVVIDASAWVDQIQDYPSQTLWQAYLVNHAIGHLLGESHETCRKAGKPAPVMMPQGGDLRGCTANPWPYP